MQQRSKTNSKEIQNVVTIASLSSTEHIVRDGGPPHRVLSDIQLRVDRAQSWGVTARTGYEIQLLLEIIGNIRPYDSGRCVLVERGMMRRKRVIQPHVFYIGDTDMLYGNMNVLEYLMFVSAKRRDDRLSMQEELFEFLVGAGFADLSLTLIKLLTPEEKAVVSLIAAAYSCVIMVIFNLPEAVFNEGLQGVIAKTSELITERGKSLIIGTKDCALIQKACSHTAFIADGRIIYQGPTESLRELFDKVAVIIDDPDIAGIKQKIEPVLTDCSLVEKEGRLLVRADGGAFVPRRLYRAILEAGVVPQRVSVNEKTVSNALEELIRQHDLSEQLY